jgi:hypothetical protein
VRPDPRPASSRRQPSEAEEREAFKRKVLALDGGCCVHDDEDECEGGLEAHHVVTQQYLRAAGRHDLLWDPRNGMAVCNRAHSRHTTAIERIALGRLPSRCYDFAMRHGFERILSRHYASAS